MAAISAQRDLALLTPAALLSEGNELIWAVTIPGVGFKVSRHDNKNTKGKPGDDDIRNGG